MSLLPDEWPVLLGWLTDRGLTVLAVDRKTGVVVVKVPDLD